MTVPIYTQITAGSTPAFTDETASAGDFAGVQADHAVQAGESAYVIPGDSFQILMDESYEESILDEMNDYVLAEA